MNKKECLELLEELQKGVENLPEGSKIISADVSHFNAPVKSRIHILDTGIPFQVNHSEQLALNSDERRYMNGVLSGNVLTFFVSDSPAVISDD